MKYMNEDYDMSYEDIHDLVYGDCHHQMTYRPSTSK